MSHNNGCLGANAVRLLQRTRGNVQGYHMLVLSIAKSRMQLTWILNHIAPEHALWERDVGHVDAVVQDRGRIDHHSVFCCTSRLRTTHQIHPAWQAPSVMAPRLCTFRCPLAPGCSMATCSGYACQIFSGFE